MSSLGVAIAQFAPTDDRVGNLAVIRRLAGLAAERGASVAVFPEYSQFFVPALGAASVAAAEAVDGPFGAAVGALAAELGIHVVAGMLELAEVGERPFNTAVAFGPDGGLVAKYRKMHLYDAFGQAESEWIQAGPAAAPELFVVDGLTFGMQICYDLRFPETTRRLVDAGADVVLAPSEWVRGPLKEHHWRTLVTARALENTVYVVAPDQAPPIGAGNSMVVDPMGVEIACIGDDTTVAVAWLSRERIDQVRAVNPALGLRRFGVVER